MSLGEEGPNQPSRAAYESIASMGMRRGFVTVPLTTINSKGRVQPQSRPKVVTSAPGVVVYS